MRYERQEVLAPPRAEGGEAYAAIFPIARQLSERTGVVLGLCHPPKVPEGPHLQEQLSPQRGYHGQKEDEQKRDTDEASPPGPAP